MNIKTKNNNEKYMKGGNIYDYARCKRLYFCSFYKE